MHTGPRPVGTVGNEEVHLSPGTRYLLTTQTGALTSSNGVKGAFQGVTKVALTVRWPTQGSTGVKVVYYTVGVGDQLVIEGDVYSSVAQQSLTPVPTPTGALATFSYPANAVNVYTLWVIPDDYQVETRLVRHRVSAQIFCPTTMGARIGSEQWVVPPGQRWRLLWISLRMDTHSTSTNHLSVFVWRGVSDNGPTIDSTGNQTVAGSYTAWSDSIDHGSSSGGTSLLIPTYPVLVPGDSVNVNYAVGDASDTVTFTVAFEVEADA